jgi:hypothetical protein
MQKINTFIRCGALLAALPLAFLACQPSPTLSRIVGTWDSYSILIQIKSAHGIVQHDSVIAIGNPAIWQAKMQQKPIRTVYSPDGNYVATYRNLRDSIVDIRLGKWTMQHDSILVLSQQDPVPMTTQYAVKFLKDGAEFRRFDYDFDEDGQNDDSFLGIQSKVQ